MGACGRALLLGASAPSFAASMDHLLRAYPDARPVSRWRRPDLARRHPSAADADGPTGHGGATAERLHPRSTAIAVPGGCAVWRDGNRIPARVRNRAFFDKMYGDCRSGQVAPERVRAGLAAEHRVHVVQHRLGERRRSRIGRGLARAGRIARAGQRYGTRWAGLYACRSVADTGADEHACLGRGDRYQPRLLRLLAMAPFDAPICRSYPYGDSGGVRASRLHLGRTMGRTTTRCISNTG